MLEAIDLRASRYTDYRKAMLDDRVAVDPLIVNDCLPEIQSVAGAEAKREQQSQKDQQPPTASSLDGVDIIADTSISVTNERQVFHWAGYGLKLHIPSLKSASLSAGVGQSDIVIKAACSLAGKFQFPDNTTLVSAVFGLQCSEKLPEPLTLEVQHCGKHSGALSFVRAECTQKALPYQFKPQVSQRGEFSSDYGTVTLSSFSYWAIVQEDSKEQQYCSRLYYFGNKSDWQVHFVVMKNLRASISAVKEVYKKKNAIEGPDYYIEFENDEITMETPEFDGRTIIKQTPAMTIMKKTVDSYDGGKYIPSCQLQVLLKKDQPPSDIDVFKAVMLRGVKKPFNQITIQSHALPAPQPPPAQPPPPGPEPGPGDGDDEPDIGPEERHTENDPNDRAPIRNGTSHSPEAAASTAPIDEIAPLLSAEDHRNPDHTSSTPTPPTGCCRRHSKFWRWFIGLVVVPLIVALFAGIIALIVKFA